MACGVCSPGKVFRKDSPSESNRMDEIHLSLARGQTLCVQAVLAPSAWGNGFLSEMLLQQLKSASGPVHLV